MELCKTIVVLLRVLPSPLLCSISSNGSLGVYTFCLRTPRGLIQRQATEY